MATDRKGQGELWLDWEEKLRRGTKAIRGVDDKPHDPTYKDSQRKSSHGGKGRQNISREDRLYDYRCFRYSIPGPPYMNDIDSIEYRFVGDKIVPLAIVELTVMEYAPPSAAALAKFLEKTWIRWFKTDSQGRFVKEMARRLDLPAYLVVLEPGAYIFHHTKIEATPAWRRLDREQYTNWIEGLDKPRW